MWPEVVTMGKDIYCGGIRFYVFTLQYSMKTVEQEEANKVDSYSAVSHQKSVRVSRFTSNSDFVS